MCERNGFEFEFAAQFLSPSSPGPRVSSDADAVGASVGGREHAVAAVEAVGRLARVAARVGAGGGGGGAISVLEENKFG